MNINNKKNAHFTNRIYFFLYIYTNCTEFTQIKILFVFSAFLSYNYISVEAPKMAYANGRELQKLAYYNGRTIITMLVFVTRDH